MERFTGIAGLGVLLAGLGLGGCTRTENIGQSGGRINPYATTRADEVSDQAHMPDLYQFSDEVAQSLASKISGIPEISQSPSRVIVELGSIENLTNTPRSDFEQIQRRIRSRLLASDIVTSRVMFVNSVQQMDAEARRVRGGETDPLRDYGEGETDRYDPRDTYVLQGAFFESSRGGGDTRRYLFEFSLTHLQSRAIVFNDSFDSAVQRY